MAKAGTVILLNRLPIFTISATSSSTDFVYDFKTGTSTTPIKSEPPTHIEAHIRCTQVTRPSATAIEPLSSLCYIIDAANKAAHAMNLSQKGFNQLAGQQ
jgi:hypothetical protein